MHATGCYDLLNHGYAAYQLLDANTSSHTTSSGLCLLEDLPI